LSAALVFDLLETRLASFVSAIAEGRRLKMRHYRLPILAVFLVGFSLGLPLFLYLRESELEKGG